MIPSPVARLFGYSTYSPVFLEVAGEVGKEREQEKPLHTFPVVESEPAALFQGHRPPAELSLCHFSFSMPQFPRL